MSEKLKPCPFCGGKAKINGGSVLCYVRCESCKARVWSCYETKEEAIAAWNQRAERTCKAVPGRMKYDERKPMCSECGYSVGDRRYNYCPNCGARIERDDHE